VQNLSSSTPAGNGLRFRSIRGETGIKLANNFRIHGDLIDIFLEHVNADHIAGLDTIKGIFEGTANYYWAVALVVGGQDFTGDTGFCGVLDKVDRQVAVLVVKGFFNEGPPCQGALTGNLGDVVETAHVEINFPALFFHIAGNLGQMSGNSSEATGIPNRFEIILDLVELTTPPENIAA
jgi:hypothetical protein